MLNHFVLKKKIAKIIDIEIDKLSKISSIPRELDLKSNEKSLARKHWLIYDKTIQNRT